MSEPSTHDPWAAADAYEAFMGRWSRPLARAFIGWVRFKPRAPRLDVGCGTGALPRAIRDLADPISVLACDPSSAFVEYARERLADTRITVVLAGAGGLPQRPAGFDAVVSGLVLNFLPDPHGALAEMRARARPGGLVAAYVWDYGGRMELLRTFWDEGVALDARAGSLDEGARFPMCRPAVLREIFRDAGLREVRSRGVEIATCFETFSDYWEPFLGGTGPAPGYVASLGAERRE